MVHHCDSQLVAGDLLERVVDLLLADQRKPVIINFTVHFVAPGHPGGVDTQDADFCTAHVETKHRRVIRGGPARVDRNKFPIRLERFQRFWQSALAQPLFD